MLQEILDHIDAVLAEVEAAPPEACFVAWDKALLRNTNGRLALIGKAVWHGSAHRAGEVALSFRWQLQGTPMFERCTIRPMTRQQALEAMRSYRAEIASLSL